MEDAQRHCRGASGAFGYAAQPWGSSRNATGWRERADLLLLDDTFKNELTESFKHALFVIFNQRTEHEPPTIVTTQDVGDTLLGRMSPDRWVRIIRHLREFCEPIVFS